MNGSRWTSRHIKAYIIGNFPISLNLKVGRGGLSLSCEQYSSTGHIITHDWLEAKLAQRTLARTCLMQRTT